MIMRLSAFAQLLLLVAATGVYRAGGNDAGISADDESRSVTLSVGKRDHLLGEPVLLKIKFHNLGNQDVKLLQYWPDFGEPPIAIFVSHDGATFHRFTFGYSDVHVGHLPHKIVKPGDTWSYELPLLYSRMSSGRLAFEKPGSYSVKTGREPATRTTLQGESNVVAVRILAPTGVDAKVWEQIRENEIFDLLQTGWGAKEPALKLARLLGEFPHTAYRPIVWNALRNFYFNKVRSLSAAERQQVRDALGIMEVAQFNDDRLQVGVAAIQGRSLTLQDLLKALSQQTSLKLDATPTLLNKSVSVPLHCTRLDACMTSVGHSFRAAWRPHEKGYYLSDEPPEVQGNAARKP
jgi:hypothetical protein